MLTNIFDATSQPALSKGSSAGRAHRAVSGKKAFPGEFSGDAPSGFLAAILQATAAGDLASRALPMSPGFGKNDTMSCGTTAELDAMPVAENAGAALPDAEVTPESATERPPVIDPDNRDAEGAGGTPGARNPSDPGGAGAAATDRVAGISLRKRPASPPHPARTPGVGMTTSPEERATGENGLPTSGPALEMPASVIEDAPHHEDLGVFSGIRDRDGSGDGENIEAAPNISQAGAAAVAVMDADGPSGDMAAPQTSTPAEVLDQAVEHARLTARGGAPEIEILLRPESLGHLRMRVSTDNRQVTVRILAEKASAAEIMEDHVAQLKADLQAAGLEMERFEVSVARDALDFRTEGRTAALTGSGGNAAAADTPAGQNDGKGSPMLAGDGFAPAGRIDFFV